MILRFQDITKSYTPVTHALKDVSFGVPAGQFCVVLGSSGAGKSTLLKLVNGLVTSTQGRIEFDGVTVTSKTLARIRPQIGMVHQQFNLVSRLNVLNNVLAGALPKVSTLRAILGYFPIDLQRRACRLLAEVGLHEEHLYRRAQTLSGGQQQRVAIARAFMLAPKLVLADEPVASLDPETSRHILQLLRTASGQHGATVLCSLHQVDLACEYADRIIAMKQGHIVFDGPPDELTSDVRHTVYGGTTEHSSGLPGNLSATTGAATDA